jgi:hypothetical protein
MHRLYGFDVFELNFNLEIDDHSFTIRKLRTPAEPVSAISADGKYRP